LINRQEKTNMTHCAGNRARFERFSRPAAVAALMAALMAIAGCAGPDMEQVRMARLEAASAMEEADYSNAIEALNRARAILPEDAGLLFELGSVYLALGEAQAADPQMGDNPGLTFGDAAQFFRQVLDLEPEHPKAGLMLSRALYMNNELEDAAGAAIEHLKRIPGDGEALAHLGRIRMTESRGQSELDSAATLGAAISDLRAAVKLDPGLETAHVALGDACIQMGRNGAARDAYEGGIRACPESNMLHERLFYLKGAQNGISPEEAVAFYSLLLEEGAALSPAARGKLLWFQGQWHGSWGLDLYAAEDYEGADEQFTWHLDCLAKSAETCPDFASDVRETAPFVRLNRGWARLQLKRFAETEEDMFACLAAFPEDPQTIQAIDSLGFAIFQNGGHEAALNFFRRLTAAHGDRHQWWNDYGFFSLETNMRNAAGPEAYDETLRIYERALELKPDYPRYVNDMAMVIDYYVDQAGARRDEVEAMYRKAWKKGQEAYESPFTDESEKTVMFSAFTDAMVNLARLYIIQGRREDFETVMAELLEIAPDRPEVRMMNRGVIPDKTSKPPDEEQPVEDEEAPAEEPEPAREAIPEDPPEDDGK
jgi:tetratricopeptide (TPR) repeat protein